MLDKLIYVTYQTFPAGTANSLQTITNIKYFIKNGTDVELYFPLRNNESSDNIKEIQNYYDISENFKLKGIKHPYPHGKLNLLKPLWFHISHYLWSKKTVKNIKDKFDKNTQFFTRSDWVAFFLAKNGRKVVFECHQTSKLRNLIVRKIKNYENVKFIYLNNHLQNYYKNVNNSIVLHNGADPDLLKKTKPKKKSNSVVFIGNVSRFNKSRGLEVILEHFATKEIGGKFKLDIVGGPSGDVERLRNFIKINGLQDSIKIHGRLDREKTAEIINETEIGLLVNAKSNLHSYKYTSPLKYFEYLLGDLAVVALDFPSHRDLPFSERINYFNLEDGKSLLVALEEAKKSQPLNINELKLISLDNRIREIIHFLK